MSKAELFGVRVSASRTSKALCVITAGVAFVLGTVIGVLIPLYVLPPLHGGEGVELGPGAGPAPQTVVQDRAAARANQPHPPTRRPPLPPRAVMPPMDDIRVVEVISEPPPEPEPEPEPESELALEPELDTTPQTSSPATTTSTAPRAANVTTTMTTTTTEEPAGPAANETVREDERTSRLTDGVFWNEAVEAALPAGFDDGAVETWRAFCRHSAVVKVEEGCGRMQNRLLTFENGTQACCRYRQNFDQIQGEIFSFLLSRQLGIRNLPPTSMMLVRPADWQWSAVRSQLSLAQWAEDRPVVLTRYQQQLELAYIPESLRGAERRLHPADLELADLRLERDRDRVLELAQWSDLIVFDYLTANLDRIVNNLYNMQWNPSMMEAPAHNLARDDSGLLLFLDNESGLLHGYRLLDKYEPYHRTMLDVTCVFRRETVRRIRRLRADGNVGELLRRAFRQRHPELLDFLPTLPEKSIKILNARLNNVHDVIERCERTYSS